MLFPGKLGGGYLNGPGESMHYLYAKFGGGAFSTTPLWGKKRISGVSIPVYIESRFEAEFDSYFEITTVGLYFGRFVWKRNQKICSDVLNLI